MNSVTFGRFNLPHPGHIDLIKRMLSLGGQAFVGISTGRNNNDYLMRREVLDQLCYREKLDPYKIHFFPSPNPFEAVEYSLKTAPATLVLGRDQSKLGEKLSQDLGVKFVPNEVRVGSSTVIRYFLEIGEEQLVRDIYHNDDFIFSDILDLRQEELLREKS
jgi:cytidyltransferase-like protein